MTQPPLLAAVVIYAVLFTDYICPIIVVIFNNIGKADAPTITDINESYSWRATGEKTVTVSGLPVGMGTVGTATFDITDVNDILDDASVVYGQGRIRYTLNTNTVDKIGSTATIKVTIPSQNYKDIIVKVNVEITYKANDDYKKRAMADPIKETYFNFDNKCRSYRKKLSGYPDLLEKYNKAYTLPFRYDVRPFFI